MEEDITLKTESVNFTHAFRGRKTASYDLHCHNFFEIYYFIGGDVQYLIEGQHFIPEPDSILLIPKNTFHGVRIDASGRYERYALHFLADLISPEYQRTLLMPFHSEQIYFRVEKRFRFRQYFDSLMECAQMDENIRLIAVKSRIEALLSQLYFMRHEQKALAHEGPKDQIVERVLRYINENITEDISLESIAARFFISKNYLNTVFRKTIGTTVGKYVCFKRATIAQQLIAEGQSAVNSAISSGFKEYSTFYRSFIKIFGHSPAQARNRNILEDYFG